jgi:mevalonate kinase
LSKIPSGLGSSGAMISNFAALLFIIQKISNNLNQNKTEQAFHGSKFVKLTKENFAEIFTIGKGISEAIFGQNSSHVDIATSIYGNTILYQKSQTPQVIQKKYSPIKEIFLIPLQSPKKDVAFTLEVIKKNNSKDFSQNCFNKINAITKKTFLAMQNNQLEKLPKYINSNQTILESLSVFDPNARLIKKILKKQQITSFKVSGTGFGDFAFSLDKQIMRAKMQINKETIKVIREKVGTEIKIKLNY